MVAEISVTPTSHKAQAQDRRHRPVALPMKASQPETQSPLSGPQHLQDGNGTCVYGRSGLLENLSGVREVKTVFIRGVPFSQC